MLPLTPSFVDPDGQAGDRWGPSTYTFCSNDFVLHEIGQCAGGHVLHDKVEVRLRVEDVVPVGNQTRKKRQRHSG